jgi:DNA-binding transcriptional LysR family regulator
LAPGSATIGHAPFMNVHHLELFYYVAKHQGISAAVRHIPYGVQQPAVSGQMLALEANLGVRLFERTPFRLTSPGRKLFAQIEPFFAGLAGLEAQLRDADRPELRLGASELVLRLHIPTVTQRLRSRYPKLQLSLTPGYQIQFETWLREGLIDLAIVPLEAKAQGRQSQLRLARVPLVLLVPKKSRWKNAAELWKQKVITEPLVALPGASSVTRSFQRDLRRLGIQWAPTVEAPSIEAVTSQVAAGAGLGVSLAIAEAIADPGVRALPLDGFAPLDTGLRWTGGMTPLLRDTILELQRYTRETWPDWSIDDALVEPKKAGRRKA